MKSTIIGVTVVLITVAVGFDLKDYGKTFKGEGTYYGGNPFNGHCAMKAPHPPKAYEGRLSVAINKPQYNNGAGCGACLRIKGNGKGLGNKPIIGPIEAYISDECPECKKGDVDLGMSGDGRWEIEWELVPCTPAPRLQILWEGSNPFYWKFQPRGLDSPVKEVSVNNIKLSRTPDNHWIFEPNKNGQAPQGIQRAKFVLSSVLGTRKEGYLEMKPSGTNYPSGSLSNKGEDAKPKENFNVDHQSKVKPTPSPATLRPKEPTPQKKTAEQASNPFTKLLSMWKLNLR